MSSCAPERIGSTEIAQTAAENLNTLGPLDVFSELILVFTRVEHVFGFGRPVDVDGFDPGANKMRPVSFERGLNLVAKRRDILNQMRAGDAALVAGLIRQESSFNPRAVSVANARGLM